MGIVYLRAEYAYLRAHLNEVIHRRREAGLLGKNVGGVEGFDFDIVVARGAGAYVCGEETALIESLEGFRGEPRNRPPFPAVAGFLNHPTVVNNVETLASVACIFAKGTDWFKGFGTDKSTGYKLFSVSGDCDKPGVYEFPWGITVADLLKEVGGGGAKAVQIGGASGVCVPAKRLRPPAGLRGHPHRRLGHGDRPAARPARRGRELPRVLRRGVVRPVHAVPPGQPQAARGRRAAQAGRPARPRTWPTSRPWGRPCRSPPSAASGQTSPSAFLSIVDAFADDVTTRPQRA